MCKNEYKYRDNPPIKRDDNPHILKDNVISKQRQLKNAKGPVGATNYGKLN